MAGAIAGTVKDIRNGQPIDGASVTAQPESHTTTTANDGTYSISLPGGSYELTITKVGYEPWVTEGIFVMDDVTTEINVALMPQE